MKEMKITPVGLKGNEVNERIKELMGVMPINENLSNSVVELTKVGPDGHVYAIVRENHRYYIKTTDKATDILAEDFKYMGGLQNKSSESYPSYAKAIKHLNIKFNSLAEAYGVSGTINVFENDNAFSAGFSQHKGSGFSNEGNMENSDPLVTEEPVEESVDEELSEDEKAIDEMCSDKAKIEEDKYPKKLSIGRSIDEMDSIIEGIARKKKVFTII